MEQEILFAAWGEIKSTQPYYSRIKKLGFKKKGKGHIKATIFGKGMKFPAIVLGGSENSLVEVYSCSQKALDKEMKNQRVGVNQKLKKVSVEMLKGDKLHNVYIFVSSYKPVAEGMEPVEYFNNQYVWNDKQKGNNLPKYMLNKQKQGNTSKNKNPKPNKNRANRSKK